MSEESKNNLNKLQRILFIIIPVFILMLVFDLASWQSIAAIIALAAFYFFLKNYLWLVVALSAPALAFGQFIVIQIKPGWNYEMSLAEAMIVGGLIIFLFDAFINKKLSSIKLDFLSIALAVYFLLAVLSYFHIMDYRFFIGAMKVHFLSLTAYFLALNLLNKPKKIRLFVYGLALTAAVLAGQIFFKFYQMGFSSQFFFARSFVTVPIGAIALVAAILAFILPLVIAFYFQMPPGKKIKPLTWLSAIAGWLALFLIMGKAAIVSFAVGMAYLFIKIKDKRIGLILAASLFVLIGYIALMPYFAGLAERTAMVLRDQSTQFRVAEYEISWEKIKDNYFFGLGAGQQPVYFRQDFRDPKYSNLVNNYFLQSLIDFGAIGLAIAVSILIYFIFLVRAPAAQTNRIIIFGFQASLIAALFNGLAEVTIFALNYAIIFWLAMGVYKNTKNNLL